MFSYFAKILKSSEYQSVLKVYFMTKKQAKMSKISKYKKIVN
ncbi:hypothetical protein HMPREF0663_10187 [Hoylesella oralis ATCC 33269]|uniref:Uncharacterized protein n=1 Tax=Hoylesella oralis ATCC 33269 TaxID=873533 RepID=E7RM37_9BACT|nr:hypothetical protein HMPREF0663_10187 [Hoylesella oralis ATCC 33269]EPH16991.1 hypothetical protein HMPREF1475_01316 [Hoylesella oralis HGA0225]SHF45296.1 hypothetical protein SAMN05444288_0660 [Hoylesella oralis]